MKKCLPLILLLFLMGCNRTSPAPAGPVFDVPSLLGKTRGEIEAMLGAAPGETRKTWQRDGVKLTAEFSQSGLLSGLLLEGAVQRDAQRDEFLKFGNLKQDDARYTLSFIEDQSQVFHFSGVRISVPQTRDVELRLDGPEVMVNLSYSAGGKAEKILTIPPWNTQSEKLQANLGETISISVSVLTKPDQLPPAEALKLQIVVDGRVLKETSAAGFAKCEMVL
jgi:hypothetical protein